MVDLEDLLIVCEDLGVHSELQCQSEQTETVLEGELVEMLV